MSQIRLESDDTIVYGAVIRTDCDAEMNLPFTEEQFFAVFSDYNEAIGWVPVVAYALGLLAVALAVRGTLRGTRVISAILTLFWGWMGAVYHLEFFIEINPLAVAFGVAFLLQSAIFLHASIRSQPIPRFTARADMRGGLGVVLMLYAMVVYPIVGIILGRSYPAVPLFGVAPCPTTIFTLGLFLWSRGPLSARLWMIPVVWALVGTTAAWTLGVWEDLGLLVATLLTVPALIHSSRHRKRDMPLT